MIFHCTAHYLMLDTYFEFKGRFKALCLEVFLSVVHLTAYEVEVLCFSHFLVEIPNTNLTQGFKGFLVPPCCSFIIIIR